MRCKHILLALKQKNPCLEKTILNYAKDHGWSIEQYDPPIPARWSGSGVITDYCSLNELRQLRCPENTPIVTRNFSNGKNIQMIAGDTWAIARMVFDYFRNRGFVNYATFETYKIETDRNSCHMPHPAITFEQVVMENKFFVIRGDLRLSDGSTFQDNFQDGVKSLQRFMVQLPKPCALFVPNLFYIGMVYRACRYGKIKIPHELAVLVNNDYSNITEYTNPTTSAVYGEVAELGMEMSRLLDDMMKGLNNESRFMQPSGIVTRQSTDILAIPHPKAAEAVSFILRNYMNMIGITEICNHADISSGTLKQLFWRFFKKQPGAFLREIRLKKACELLITSNRGLDDIAESVGYGSAMSLSLAFKREFKLTPGCYRMLHSSHGLIHKEQ